MPVLNHQKWGLIAWGLGRFLVSSHFVFELQDKIVNFNYWRGVIHQQAGFGVWSLILVIVLLVVGCASLLSGRWLWIGFLALAIFQIPTSILFEDSLYESFDSASALGGVFAVAAWTWDREGKKDFREEISSRRESEPAVDTYGTQGQLLDP